MKKTFKLTGEALDLALDIKAGVDADRNALEELQEQATAISEAGELRINNQRKRMRELLDMEDGACVHLDFSYLEEHGEAYLKTGCERPDFSYLEEHGEAYLKTGCERPDFSSFLGRMMGADTPTSGGGLH